MVNVDVWADVRCPWCWIGLRRLRRVSAQGDTPVTVRRRSFLLEPQGPSVTGLTTAQVATSQWGMTAAQWNANSSRIQAEGRAEGLDINVDGALTFDSRPIHRLLQLAAATDSVDTDAAWDSAFEAHFGRNENLGDPETLRKLAATWGLDAAEADRAVTGETYGAQVDRDLSAARQLAVTSVPTIVAADGRRISGTAPVSQLSAFLGGARSTR